MSFRVSVLQIILATVGCVGLAWGVAVIPSSEAADDLRDMKRQLLRSETFTPKTLALKVANANSENVSPCDDHAQVALLLMEMQLAEIALRSGEVTKFDQRTQSIEIRTRRALNCTPRQSFIWLMAFSAEVLHGRINDRTFGLLAMSHETSPNEGWISIRRNAVSIPLILSMPDNLRQQTLSEFQQLVRNGFRDEAALSYSAAPPEIRRLLQNQIGELGPSEQRAFREAVEKVQS